MVFWAFACVGVHRLSLRLKYLGVFPFTLLHLPLNFIRVPSLITTDVSAPMAIGRPFTYSLLGEFPGLELALVPNVVVPEAEQRCALSRNLISNFCRACSLMATNVTTGLRRTPMQCSNCRGVGVEPPYLILPTPLPLVKIRPRGGRVSPPPPKFC